MIELILTVCAPNAPSQCDAMHDAGAALHRCLVGPASGHARHAVAMRFSREAGQKI